MERLGLSEGFSQTKSGAASSSRKLPMRFAISPGNTIVVTEFVNFNTIIKTRVMTMTAVKSKSVYPRQQMVESGATSGLNLSSGNGNHGGHLIGSPSFVFGAGNQLQASAMRIEGTRVFAEGNVSNLQSGFINALRMPVFPTNLKQHGSGLGDELGEIILVARSNALDQGNNLMVDPIREDQASDADDEGSDHDQYLDMDSIESFDVSLPDYILLRRVWLMIKTNRKREFLK